MGTTWGGDMLQVRPFNRSDELRGIFRRAWGSRFVNLIFEVMASVNAVAGDHLTNRERT
jgi:hypothetical protein